MKNKGFLMLESVVSLMITMIAVFALNETIISGRKTEKRLEQKVDYHLAKRIMRQNRLSQVVIHDRKYQDEK